ncbi:hypothetical protein HBI25_174800 [Parastagonospora nodorum]|nr:hypothetical protein HBI71_152800 [Parastagonospora nodorum]KAH5553268.1 hypothetical protein HBI25_174800 [Parastagonospora nodorum]KAH5691390.1 hypothetical protein HBI44_168280 [Parastagonospora nodorum]KAH6230719.1 hypothetical protein HBI15_078470 [Parastagonospora nodorum]
MNVCMILRFLVAPNDHRVCYVQVSNRRITALQLRRPKTTSTVMLPALRRDGKRKSGSLFNTRLAR